MADKTVYGRVETGTWDTSSPTPHVSLSGTSPAGYAIEALFVDALSDGDTCTVTVRKDRSTWAVYSGAVFTTGTPNLFDLSAATLRDSSGTLSNSDAVEVLGLAAAATLEVDAAITTASLTATLNTRYRLDVSGLTADRALVLPGSAVAGDWISWELVSDAPEDYSLLIAGDTGVVVDNGRVSYTASTADYFHAMGDSGRTVYDGAAWVLSAQKSDRPTDLIINGGHDVWQLGESFVSPTHVSITADRWVYGQLNGTAEWTISRVTDDSPRPEIKSAIKTLCTTADTTIGTDDESHLRYALEGYDLAKLMGRHAVLTFWVKSNLTGTFSIAFANSGSDRALVAEYTIDAADTWELKSVPVPFNDAGGTWDYINGVGLKIRFCWRVGTTYAGTVGAWNTSNKVGSANQVNLAADVDNYWMLAGVTFGFGYRPITYTPKLVAEVMSSCERYLQVFSADVAGVNTGQGIASTVNTVNFDFMISPMRAAPTAKFIGSQGTDYAVTNFASTNITGCSLDNYSRSKTMLKFLVTKSASFTAGDVYLFRLLTTSGKLVADAEL